MMCSLSYCCLYFLITVYSLYRLLLLTIYASISSKQCQSFRHVHFEFSKLVLISFNSSFKMVLRLLKASSFMIHVIILFYSITVFPFSWKTNADLTVVVSNCSQNHRMLGVGRDLCGSSGPTLLPKQCHLQQAAQDLVQAGLEYLSDISGTDFVLHVFNAAEVNVALCLAFFLCHSIIRCLKNIELLWHFTNISSLTVPSFAILVLGFAFAWHLTQAWSSCVSGPLGI